MVLGTHDGGSHDTLSIVCKQIPDMDAALWDLLQQIPAGSVTTYGAIARALGDVKASRWVGTVLLHHRHDPTCSCHRVVRSDGNLGKYVTGDVTEKRDLLQAEGSLAADGRADLVRRFVGQFTSHQPLALLRQHQVSISKRIALRGAVKNPSLVGGMDISYSDGVASASLVCIATDSPQPLWHESISTPIQFPYISSYLSFRELPAYLMLLEQVRKSRELSSVVLVDGSGILHPRRCGIASMLGVTAGMATIGVTKKRLCGEFSADALASRGSASVVLDGDEVGAVTYGASASKKPLFVSPGHRVDVGAALRITRQFWGSRRLPAPIHWADWLSRRTARDEG